MPKIENTGQINIVEDQPVHEQPVEHSPCYRSEGLEVPNLADLEFETSYRGGATLGIDVYVDKTTGKKWCVKSWPRKSEAVSEIIAGALLDKLGMKTPKSLAYENLPEKFITEGREKDVFFRLSEFIEGEQPGFKEAKKGLKPHYASLAFLSMWDTKSNNLVSVENEDGKTEFYNIDLGSALLLRATGVSKAEDRKESPWSAFQVTELGSFETHGSTFEHTQNITEDTRYVLRPKSEEKFYTQIDEILAKQDEILSLADNMCVQFAYDKRAQLMGMLTARFQHYEMLKQIRDGKLSESAERFSLAGAFDSAGVMTWAMHEGQPHILIGLRSEGVGEGVGTWCILGGGSDKGETFSEIAAREVFEESGEKIKLQSVDLENAPTHDMITLQENGDFRRFRTYLAEVQYIDPTTIEGDAGEYDAYEWVPVSNLIEAAESDDGKFDLNGEEEELLPAFKDALNQPQVKSWMESLNEGKQDSIRKEVTQNIANPPQKIKAKRYKERVETQYSKERRTTEVMAKGVFHKESFKKELAQRAVEVKTGHKVTEVESVEERLETISLDQTPTASRQMLHRLYPGEEFDKQITHAISDAKEIKESEVTEEQISLVKDIMTAEAENPEAYFAYHALQSEIWLTYRVLSFIRHELEGTELQTDVLRTLQSAFDALPDAKALLDFMLEGGDEEGRDYHGISANPTLFSNIENFIKGTGESSLEFFLKAENVSAPKDIWKICGNLFNAMGLPAEELTENLKALHAQELASHGAEGALLQIMFDTPELVDEASYASSDFGHALVTKEDIKQTVQPSSMIDSLKQNEEQTFVKKAEKNEMQSAAEFQLRLHADLPTVQAENKGQIKVNDHFTGEVDVEKVDQEIEGMLSKHMPKILHSLLRDSETYSKSSPTLQKAARVVLDVRDFEQEDLSPIARAYLNNDVEKLIELLFDDPNLLNEGIVNPRTTEVTYLKDVPDFNDLVTLMQEHKEEIKNLLPYVNKNMNGFIIHHFMKEALAIERGEDRINFAEKFSKITTPNMTNENNPYTINKFFESFKTILDDDLMFSNLLKLKTNKMGTYGVIELIKKFNEVKNIAGDDPVIFNRIIDNVSHLIHVESDYFYIQVIIDAVINYECQKSILPHNYPDDLSDIIIAIKPIIIPEMSGNDVKRILLKFIDSPNRALIVRDIKTVFDSRMRSEEVLYLADKLEELAEKENAEKIDILQKAVTIWTRTLAFDDGRQLRHSNGIIKALEMAENSELRQYIFEFTLKMIEMDITSINVLVPFIERLSKLHSKEEIEKEATNILKGMIPGDIFENAKFIRSLPSLEA